MHSRPVTNQAPPHHHHHPPTHALPLTLKLNRAQGMSLFFRGEPLTTVEAIRGLNILHYLPSYSLPLCCDTYLKYQSYEGLNKIFESQEMPALCDNTEFHPSRLNRKSGEGVLRGGTAKK